MHTLNYIEEVSQHTRTHAFTKLQPKTTKRDDPSSVFPTSSFMTVSPHYIQPFDKTSKHFLSDSSYKSKATTVTLPNRDGFTISENVGTSQFDLIFWSSNTMTDDNQRISSEMDRTDRSPRSTNPDQTLLIKQSMMIQYSLLVHLQQYQSFQMLIKPTH